MGGPADEEACATVFSKFEQRLSCADDGGWQFLVASFDVIHLQKNRLLNI